MTLAEMLHLSWGWQGPLEVREPNEDPHFEIRVAELPEFFAAGRTREEALAAAGPALAAFLKSYVEAGEEPPLPERREVTWIVKAPAVSAPKKLPEVRDPAKQLITA